MTASTNMHKVLLTSETFQHSYCVFISRESAEFFDDYIGATQWKTNYGVRVIDADFQEKLSCIVIPNHLNFKLFETHLCEFKRKHKNKFVKNSGFWGQLGIGYENKHWTTR